MPDREQILLAELEQAEKERDKWKRFYDIVVIGQRADLERRLARACLALLAELKQADKLAEAASLVCELDLRELFGDETLDGFEWGRATTALRAALADWKAADA